MKVENTNNKFLTVTSDEGMVITEWNDGDDIMNYNGAKKLYCPLTTDLEKFREITDEEHFELLELQEAEAEKREKESLKSQDAEAEITEAEEFELPETMEAEAVITDGRE